MDMKKRILILFVIALPLIVCGAEWISKKAWRNLQEIQKWHLECVGKKTDRLKDKETEEFLENTITNYFFETIKKNTEYQDKIKKLETEYQDEIKNLKTVNQQLKTEKNSFQCVTIILGILLVLILSIPIVLVLKTKKQNSRKTSPTHNGCPRCGEIFDDSKGKCPNCGTNI